VVSIVWCVPDARLRAIIDGMSRRFLNRWEVLTGRGRELVGIPVAWVVLFLFHQMFPLLSQVDRAMYATMEAVPVALVLAWATQNELRRRAERADAIQRWEADNPGQTWNG
jgi:hypothetical protein